VYVCLVETKAVLRILRLFSFFVLNNVPFLSVRSITAYAFSRWMNFCVLGLCSRNWNYERLCRAPIRSVFTSPFQVQQEWKTAKRLASRPGLPYNVGFVRELAGKRVCHGNSGPNPQTVGHLGCLHDMWCHVKFERFRITVCRDSSLQINLHRTFRLLRNKGS